MINFLRQMLGFLRPMLVFLLHALKEMFGVSRLEHIAFVDTLDGVAHGCEEAFDIVRHVVGDGHHLDGAGATFGAESLIIVGAG